MDADLVLVSIGYQGMPLEGMEEMQIFDEERGIVSNVHGKVVGSNNLFVTGWIKRGPTGIIGTNIMDAKETVNSVMSFIGSDSGSGSISRSGSGIAAGQSSLSSLQKIVPKEEASMVRGRDGLEEYLKSNKVEYVSWNQFQRIESLEREPSRLRCDSQPREKFLSVEEMLQAAQVKSDIDTK